MKFKSLLLFCFLFFSTVFTPAFAPILGATDTDEWKLRKESEGIMVYTRPVKGSPYHEFRAITKAKTSLFSLVAIWADPVSYSQWMYDCKSADLLNQESSKKLYIYIVSSIPWPLTTRDNILYSETSQDDKNGKITIKLMAKPEYIPQNKNMVRVVKAYGKIELTPLEDGETKVIFELYLDPGGFVPASIANYYVIDYPFFTLKKMSEEVKKQKYQEANFDFFRNSNYGK
jgi:hypothetical protein